MATKLDIQMHPTPEYSCRQAVADHLPSVPLRGLILGPSASGKTRAMVDMIVRLYRGCFSRVYVFSPSIDVDRSWDPVKKYSEEELGVDPQEEKCFFSTWDTGALEEIVSTMQKITEKSKKIGMKRLYSILIVVDDFADQPHIMHSTRGGGAAGGSMLNTLAVRGRHLQVSSLISSQKINLVAPTVLVNLSFYMVFRLRSGKELFDSVLYQLSALYSMKQLYEMYEAATKDPYSFWFIDLIPRSGKKEDMFWLRFGARMIPRADASANGAKPVADSSSLLPQTAETPSDSQVAPPAAPQK